MSWGSGLVQIIKVEFLSSTYYVQWFSNWISSKPCFQSYTDTNPQETTWLCSFLQLMYIFRVLSVWQWRWQCQQTLSEDEIYSSSYVIPPVWLWRETKFKSLEEFYFDFSWLIFAVLLLILSLLWIVFTSSLYEYTNNLRFRSCQVSHICQWKCKARNSLW